MYIRRQVQYKQSQSNNEGMLQDERDQLLPQ